MRDLSEEERAGEGGEGGRERRRERVIGKDKERAERKRERERGGGGGREGARELGSEEQDRSDQGGRACACVRKLGEYNDRREGESKSE